MTGVEKEMISAKVDKKLKQLLDEYAAEIQVSRSWVVQQALKHYFDRYDESISDMRIASLAETISHEDVLKEYGIQD